MQYINTFAEGSRVSGVYLCKHKQAATTRNGKEYYNVTLQDKTGTADAKIWEVNSPGVDDFSVLDYVAVEGDVIVYNGNIQLNIRRIRTAAENEYNPADYLPMTKKDRNQMYREMKDMIAKIGEPHLKRLAESYFVDDMDFVKKFGSHSAAKSVHHGFVGGLMEHTLGVMKLCEYYADHYPMLNRDLLITAALFHDIGKTEELSDFPENDYTDYGQLIGHIVIGAEMVHERIKTIDGFPPKLARELEHCILAHHGELEFGSPKKPALLEALALNLADNTDAKIETMMEALANGGAGTGEDGWLGFNRFLDSNIRRTTGNEYAAPKAAPAAGSGSAPGSRPGQNGRNQHGGRENQHFGSRIVIPGFGDNS
jgi:3'-5' exoribonuclease